MQNGHDGSGVNGTSGFRQIGGIPITLPPSQAPRPQSAGTAVALRNAASTAAAVDLDRLVLESVPASVSQRVTECRRDISTAQWGYETQLSGYTLSAGADPDDLWAAIDIVEESLRPCPSETAEIELHRLKVRTTGRGLSEQDMAMAIIIYAEDLCEYPADAVIGALRHWGSNNKWWPTWSELKDLLDERCERRKALLKALLRGPVGPTAAERAAAIRAAEEREREAAAKVPLIGFFVAARHCPERGHLPEPTPPRQQGLDQHLMPPRRQGRKLPLDDRKPLSATAVAIIGAGLRAVENIARPLPEMDDPDVQDWMRQMGV